MNQSWVRYPLLYTEKNRPQNETKYIFCSKKISFSVSTLSWRQTKRMRKMVWPHRCTWISNYIVIWMHLTVCINKYFFFSDFISVVDQFRGNRCEPNKSRYSRSLSKWFEEREEKTTTKIYGYFTTSHRFSHISSSISLFFGSAVHRRPEEATLSTSESFFSFFTSLFSLIRFLFAFNSFRFQFILFLFILLIDVIRKYSFRSWTWLSKRTKHSNDVMMKMMAMQINVEIEIRLYSSSDRTLNANALKLGQFRCVDAHQWMESTTNARMQLTHAWYPVSCWYRKRKWLNFLRKLWNFFVRSHFNINNEQGKSIVKSNQKVNCKLFVEVLTLRRCLSFM